jgi:hypothetical protein
MASAQKPVAAPLQYSQVALGVPTIGRLRTWITPSTVVCSAIVKSESLPPLLSRYIMQFPMVASV